MNRSITLLVVSDIHYAGPGELERRNPEGSVVQQTCLRPVASTFRALWLGQLSRNNALFEAFLKRTPATELVVANGDFSCDSAFVGVSDDAAFGSVRECLGKLRARFGKHLKATIGDHELGRRSLFGGSGGLRLASWQRLVGELSLEPFWQVSLGCYEIIGVTSSLLALDAVESQLLPEERESWHGLRSQHRDQIRRAFDALDRNRRVLLFCHDPAALAWLQHEPAVRERLGQIELTLAGHLHFQSVIAGVRLVAQRRNSLWRDFKVRVCPALACRRSPFGGFYCEVFLDSEARNPLRLLLHRFRSPPKTILSTKRTTAN